MRGLCTEPCMSENKVIKMLQAWCPLLNLYPGCVTGFSLLLKHAVSQAGKGIFPSLTPLALSFVQVVFITGTQQPVFHPMFFNHRCVLLTLILTFIFEAYPYCLLDFKGWCGWMTVPRKMCTTFKLIRHSFDMPLVCQTQTGVTSSSKSFNFSSGRKLENGTWGIVLYD